MRCLSKKNKKKKKQQWLFDNKNKKFENPCYKEKTLKK